MDNYGQITPTMLSDKEEDLKKINYDPTNPIDTIFNKIKHHQDIFELVDKFKSDNQLINLGYIIL